LLHPGRGILILEVKDWKADTIKRGDKSTFQILTNNGLKHVANPLDQGRQYAHAIVNLLIKDPQLHQKDSRYQGRLIAPYGYGVVFSNLTRQQAEKMGLTQVIDERL